MDDKRVCGAKGGVMDALITIGYHKGELDYGVSAQVGALTLKQMREVRQMIVVAIWCAEDMWRRNQLAEAAATAGPEEEP